MKLAKGLVLASGVGALALALVYGQARASEPAAAAKADGSAAVAAQAQQPTTAAPRAQSTRRYRSYSYQPSSGGRVYRANRLPTWGRADSKVHFRYGVYPY